ncbi:ABC transporter ATP-binding protein [Candidatus Mycoplasma haematobovis]|uniref:ABC transporter ATP-binding protein n=1 Tax=Candidatus Mycoplasma haematobovis TaxID=432608 RepID=A0A1A9QCS9_9MOLU|nr:ATP-binding cassette domain-containing protein [Candidatus Mycoplasma haematobovis]OAL10277.1 ABC transporter ATP-binding protein [Candidatus Mycoplasma haematobovis]
MSKDIISNSEKLNEYENLKKTFKELETREKELKEYLNVNVFSYAQNKENLEDIFEIRNSSLVLSRENNVNIPILEINHLTKYYASKKIPSLLNLNLKIYLGDLHVIVGVSGSGKTTLFNCIKGIENYEGEIIIDGRELKLETFPKNLVSFVSHDIEWNIYSTVEEVFLKKFQDLGMTEIEAQNYMRSALEQFNLTYLRNHLVIDLTLLEKRKIQIMFALATDPSLIVFDETFLGLQQYECLDLLVIFSKLKRDNRAILFLSHSFDNFPKFSNTISILSKGKIYYTGLVENLFLTQQNKYSISTMDNKAALAILSKIKCNFSYNEIIDTIYVKFDGKLNLLLFQKECVQKNIIIQEIRPIETNINDLYPVLVKVGNRQAIKDINTKRYFTPK